MGASAPKTYQRMAKAHIIRQDKYKKGTKYDKAHLIDNVLSDENVDIEIKEAAKMSDGKEYIVLKIEL